MISHGTSKGFYNPNRITMPQISGLHETSLNGPSVKNSLFGPQRHPSLMMPAAKQDSVFRHPGKNTRHNGSLDMLTLK